MPVVLDGPTLVREYGEGQGITALRKKYRTSFKAVKNALVREGVQLRAHHDTNRKFVTQHTFFDQVDTPEKAYLLGVLCADGNVRGNMVRLEVQEADREMVETFHRLLGGGPPRTYTRTQRGENKQRVTTTAFASVASPPLVVALRRLGVTERKTWSLSLRWDLIPADLWRYVALGVVDGDGNWHLHKGQRSRSALQIVTASEAFARELVHVVPGAELSSRTSPRGAVHWVVRVRSLQRLWSVIEWLYDGRAPALQRKQERARGMLALLGLSRGDYRATK